jgi:integrase
MARPNTGSLRLDTRPKSPTWEARFTIAGRKYSQRIGSIAEGWTEAKAEQERQNIMADVRRGLWKPPTPEVAELPREVPTFHVFSSEWFERQCLEGGRRGEGLAESSRRDLQWQLSEHLLPFFGGKRLDAITVEDVDRYRLSKVRDSNLGVSSINKTLTVLSAVLEAALEYELVARNVARGRRRRLPAVAPTRSWLDRGEHITALLDGAGELDRMGRARRGQRRALLATLVFAGLRIGEAVALRWRDIDLARGTITVRAAKTPAGVRTVYIVPALRDELTEYRARLDPRPDVLVFGSSMGREQSTSNIRRRILARAVDRANQKLAKAKIEPLPENLTPHSLRRTFASLLFAIGESPPYVMGQMGHTTPSLTLAIYARQMDRRDGELERLKALVEGAEWTVIDGSGAKAAAEAVVGSDEHEQKTAQ